MFSSRLPDRLTTNLVSRVVAGRHASGAPLIDLTETNPTTVGLAYPAEVSTALADPRSTRYVPLPFGLEEARRAAAATYDTPHPASPERVVLTASTSEAYALLFKLLCDPGDEVLVPRPSYPLFDLLTRLEGVRETPYRLDRDDGWRIDRRSLERAWSPRAKAVLVVSPNNPTGSRLRLDERDWLAAFAGAQGLAVISDEVFLDYPLATRPEATSFAGEDRVLTFTLGGLSKSAGLPQMKLAWMLASGPEAVVSDALERLSVIADSYLSVSTPVQLAAARLIAAGHAVRAAIRERILSNLSCLTALIGQRSEVTLYAPEGGWSAVFRVPAILSDDEFVVRLVERHGVLLHPGYFFDLEGDGLLVTSLLPRPADFEQGIRAMLELVSEAGR
jgi:aspartate/methionine/tyrosine aminotransferase